MWKHLWNLWENTIPKSFTQNKPTRNNKVHIITDTHIRAHPIWPTQDVGLRAIGDNTDKQHFINKSL